MRPFQKKSVASASSAPSPEDLARLLKEHDIRLAPAGLEKLWRYHSLLRQRNQDRELTRLVGFHTIVVKHYVDCLIVGNLWRLPSPLVDLGTGAGFPGIPLKIRYPNLELILAEPRPKRITFLKEAIQKVGLTQTSVFEHKVVSRSFTKPVPGYITRAVETMDKTVLRTSGSLTLGGELIFMKGPHADQELRDCLKRFGQHFSLKADIKYRLPKSTHERRLIVLEKTSEWAKTPH